MINKLALILQNIWRQLITCQFNFCFLSIETPRYWKTIIKWSDILIIFTNYTYRSIPKTPKPLELLCGNIKVEWCTVSNFDQDGRSQVPLHRLGGVEDPSSEFFRRKCAGRRFSESARFSENLRILFLASPCLITIYQAKLSADISSEHDISGRLMT